jgi:hypothetical protein
MTTLISLALWLAAAGQAMLLVVSVQVPGKLQWRTQLARLDAANRKLYVVATGYIVFTYLAFAVLTAVLHENFVRGEAAAIGLSVFIGLYWLIRVAVVDRIFGGDPWPAGRRFVVARIVLELAFAGLALTYLGTALWHLTR